MGRNSKIICLWPGLPRLWLLGEFSGLIVALCFTAALNLALISSFLWMDSLSLVRASIVWGALVTFWVVSLRHALLEFSEIAEAAVDDPQGLFLQAQGQYLKGNFERAQQILLRLLRGSPRDADARLLLASAFRRGGKSQQARLELARLESQGTEKWGFEIRREREILNAENPARPLAATDVPSPPRGEKMAEGRMRGPGRENLRTTRRL